MLYWGVVSPQICYIVWSQVAKSCGSLLLSKMGRLTVVHGLKLPFFSLRGLNKKCYNGDFSQNA